MARAKRRFKPMGFADILDEAFDLYKSNFVLLVGIGAVVYGPLSLLFGTAMALQFQAMNPFDPTAQPNMATDFSSMAGAIGIYLLAGLVALIGYPLVTGATTVAISRRYLGEPITIRESYQFTRAKLWPLVTTVLLYMVVTSLPSFLIQFFAMALAPMIMLAGSASPVLIAIMAAVIFLLILGSLVLTAMIYVKTAFVAPVFVVEGKANIASITRSWDLTNQHGWRIFGVLAVALIAVLIICYALLIPAMVGSMFLSEGGNVAISAAILSAVMALVYIVLIPLIWIVVVVLYYDIRIRKEGYDLQMLAKDLNPENAGG